MPSIGVLEPAISRAMRSIVPSPPNTMSRSASLETAAASGYVGTSRPASVAVAMSVKTVRPELRINSAASCTRVRQDGFSEFAISPMRLLPNLFNQHQKFLIPGRAEQRRFGVANPLDWSFEFLDPLTQFTQHPLMDGRIANHP